MLAYTFLVHPTNAGKHIAIPEIQKNIHIRTLFLKLNTLKHNKGQGDEKMTVVCRMAKTNKAFILLESGGPKEQFSGIDAGRIRHLSVPKP